MTYCVPTTQKVFGCIMILVCGKSCSYGDKSILLARSSLLWWRQASWCFFYQYSYQKYMQVFIIFPRCSPFIIDVSTCFNQTRQTRFIVSHQRPHPLKPAALSPFEMSTFNGRSAILCMLYVTPASSKACRLIAFRNAHF